MSVGAHHGGITPDGSYFGPGVHAGPACRYRPEQPYDPGSVLAFYPVPVGSTRVEVTVGGGNPEFFNALGWAIVVIKADTYGLKTKTQLQPVLLDQTNGKLFTPAELDTAGTVLEWSVASVENVPGSVR